jgi:hypothetical protein
MTPYFVLLNFENISSESKGEGIIGREMEVQDLGEGMQVKQKK